MTAAALSAFAAGSNAQATIIANNLILRIWGKDKALLEARVLAAAMAVGSEGKLILEYSKIGDAEQDLAIEPRDLIESLPKDLRKKILLVKSNENYSYPRDTSRGWGIDSQGHYKLYGNKSGNRVTDPQGKTFDSYSTLGIAALLNACEDGDFALPSLSSFSSQGGEIVGNGEGICIVNADIQKTDRVTDDFKDHLKVLGCKEVIPISSIHEWRELGLMNGHADFAASFVGPKTVMIPSVDEACSNEIKEKYKEKWKKLKTKLLARHLDVVEVPIGGGCIERNLEIAKGRPGSYYIRSYSNAVVMNESILLPQFIGTNIQEAKALAVYNERAQATLKRLMSEGKIPVRRIVGFPIDENPVKGGGEVRCMSLEVPGRIRHCTQEKLNKAVEQQVAQAKQSADCLGSEFDPTLCRAAQQIYETLHFLHGEPGRLRVMTTEDGAIIQILDSYRDLIGAAIEKLRIALARCSKT